MAYFNTRKTMLIGLKGEKGTGTEDINAIHKTGDETAAGIKNFTGTLNYQGLEVATKSYVNSAIETAVTIAINTAV